MSKKMLYRVLCSVALAFAAVLALASPAFADDYTYTVRVLGGSQGTYDGQEVAVLGPFAYGEECTLELDKVAVNDGAKYYPKGFKVAGQDALAKANFSVYEDMDFVVAYGVKGKMVPYTIHFVEATNNNGQWTWDENSPAVRAEVPNGDSGVTLKTEATYEGKVGDQPVIAYSYAPGFRPLYKNITGKIKDGANDWYLPYVRIEQEQQQEQQQQQTTTPKQQTTETVVTETTTTTTPTTTTTTTTTPTTTTTTTPTPTTTESTVTPENGEQGTNEGGNAGNEGVEGTPTTPTTPVNPTVEEPEPTTTNPPATQEIYDVDNPLAAPNSGESTTPTDTNNGGGNGEPEGNKPSGISGPIIAALIAAAIAAIGGIVYFVLRRRSEADYDDEL